MNIEAFRSVLPQGVQEVLNSIIPIPEQSLALVDTELEQRLRDHQETISKDITQLVQDLETEPNLCKLEKRLIDFQELFKEDRLLRATIDEFPEKFAGNEALKGSFTLEFHKMTAFLKSELDMIQEQLKSRDGVLKKQKNWLKLEFPESVITSSPDFVDFVMDSGLGFKIVMFQNTTKVGKDLHVISCDEDGHPLMRCNGKMQRWEEIKKQCFYDPVQAKIVTLEKKEQGWNYISPKGLVEKDPYDYEHLYAIEKLPQDEYKELLTQAEKFWETNDEIDKGEKKDCVFQIVTTKRSYLPAWVPSFLSDNFEKNAPSHTFMRFIKPNGKVYSFGFEMKHSEQQQVLANLPFTLLMSGLTKYSTSDYEEPRKFDLRFVTSVPVTRERLKASLDYVVEKNKGGLRFCFKDDNCTKGTVNVAKMSGITDLDPTMTIREFFWRILPDFEKIPVIGPMLIDLTSKIQMLSNAVLQAIPPVTCDAIDGVSKTLSDTVQHLAKSLENIFYNALIYLMGGAEMTIALQEMKRRAEETFAVAPQAMTLFNDGLDFLKDPTGGLFHSVKVMEWQEKQSSTVAIPYEGKPRLYLHPRAVEIKA